MANENAGAAAGAGAAQNAAQNGSGSQPQPDQNPNGGQAAADGAAVNADAFEADEVVDLGEGKMSWNDLVAAGRERLKSAKAGSGAAAGGEGGNGGQGAGGGKPQGDPIDPRDQALLGLTKEVFEMKAEKAVEQFPNATVADIRRRLLDLAPDKRDLKKIPEIAKEIHEEIEARVAKRHETYIKEKSEAARKDLIGGGGAPVPSGEGSDKPITLDDAAELSKRVQTYLKKT
jgi:hypothetical protein